MYGRRGSLRLEKGRRKSSQPVMRSMVEVKGSQLASFLV